MNPFRKLDEIVVPRLGRGLARVLGAVGGPKRRPNLLPVTAVVLLIAAIGAVAYVGNRPDPVDTSVGDVARVGAVDGERVPSYLSRSAIELDALSTHSTGETYALVALESYTEPAALAGLFAGVRTELAYARVPLARVQTEIVTLPAHALPTAVAVGMREAAARKEGAARDARWAAGKLTGPDPRERALRAGYLDTARVDGAEAAAYRSLCACVYGVVVRGTPLRLRQLAARPGIRAVDAAPDVRRLDRAVFLPLRPEESTVVSPPEDKPR